MLTNKIALVTGTNSGIGKHTAIALAKNGAKVVLSDVKENTATLEAIQSAGGEGIFVKCDVRDEAQIIALVNACKQRFGRLDIAFNNAGIPGESAPVADCTESNWHNTLSINLTGVWRCMKHQIPLMLSSGGGSITNNASVAGLVGFSHANPAYIASKHGVVGLTKSAALDYATQHIRVNAICPGIIKTPIIDRVIAESPETGQQLTYATPMARIGDPDEIANTVVFLSSDAASFITGQAIAVDGGWIAQ